MKRKHLPARTGSIWIIMVVRYMLLIPILYGIGYITYVVLTQGWNTSTYSIIGSNIRIILLTLIAMMVTFGFARLEKRLDVHLPKLLLAIIMLFVVAALVLGDAYGNYDRYWWWDDMLHSLAGVIMALVGFLMVYFLNARYNMNISPVFVAMFTFTFAITMGVIWEIIEFAIDYAYPSNMQGWSQAAGGLLMGRDYQGNGLRDTMSDLIVACVWAFVTSVGAYFSYKNSRRKVLRVMRRTFPGLSARR